MSNRKPFNEYAGYIASCKNPLTGNHNVIYIAAEQGISADKKYVTTCEAHHTMVSSSSTPGARLAMKDASIWCDECKKLAVTQSGVLISLDEQQEKYNTQEKARRDTLSPGTKVQVWLATGSGFTVMKVVAVQIIPIQNATTKYIVDTPLYQLEDSYHRTYHTTADFIAKVY